MRNWLAMIIFLGVALFAVNWIIEQKTQERASELQSELQRLAPVGRARVEVEQALAEQGLEHVFGPSENTIYGKKTVGRYRLLYTTEVAYKVRLDEQARVARVESTVFNEGL